MSPHLRRRLLLLAPFAVVAAGGAAFFGLLQGMQRGQFNPRGVPSALIGRPAPFFDLPEVPGVEVPLLRHADVASPGRPVIVNFWASWCMPCVVEHPQLMALARAGVPVFGIAYKDRPEASREFLRRHGNPFARLARDESGRAAIDWGVYGVPETYLIDPHGIVRWRFAGAITPEILAEDIRPLLARHAT